MSFGIFFWSQRQFDKIRTLRTLDERAGQQSVAINQQNITEKNDERNRYE
jgi:hypothetical protein